MRKPVDIGKVLLIGLAVVVVIALIVCFEMFNRVKINENKPVDNLVDDKPKKSDSPWHTSSEESSESDESAVSEDVVSEEVSSEEKPTSQETVPEDLPPELQNLQAGAEFINVPWDTLGEVYHYFDDSPSFKNIDEVGFQKIMDAYFWSCDEFRDGKYKLTPFEGDSVAIHHAIQDPYRDPEDKDFRYVAGPNFNYKISLEELNKFAREFFGQDVREVTAGAVPNKIYGENVNTRAANARVYYYNGALYMNVERKAKNSENRYFIASANDGGRKIELIVFYVKPKLNAENEGKDHMDLQEVYRNSMIDGYIRKKITLEQGFNDFWHITSSRTMSRYKM